MSESNSCVISLFFHISAVYHRHLRDGEDFGTVSSLAGFINIEQKLCHKSKGLKICLDLGRIQEVKFVLLFLHCI